MLDKLQDEFDSMTASVDKMKEDGHGQQKSLEELFRIVGHLQVRYTLADYSQWTLMIEELSQ